MLGKVCGRAPRLRLKAKLRRLLALLLGLIGLRSLKRGPRSDCGVVARETRPSIPRHRRRSLRSRTWPVQPRWPLSDSVGGRVDKSAARGPLSPRGTDPSADPYRGASRCRIVPVGARFPNTNRLSRIGEARVQFPGPVFMCCSLASRMSMSIGWGTDRGRAGGARRGDGELG
jgi:hypothetical protein